MSRRETLGWLPVSAAVIGMGVSVASAAEPSYEDLKQQVQQLQDRVQSLETQRPASTADTDATVARIIQDADRRSQLLSSGAVTAGYDKGFFIKSEDGSFLLRPSIQFQFRSISTIASDGETDVESGFEVRRARFRFDGNVISPNLTYSFVWDTSRSGGAVTLLDAWAQYRFADAWAVKLGQFKESFSHEKDVSGFSQLAVDRSLVDALLGGSVIDRVQGVSLIYGGTKTTPARVELSFNDGANSKNTDFLDAGGANFGAGLRAEYKLAGNWNDYKDFTARETKENLLVLGAGSEITQVGDADVLMNTADVQWKSPSGWSLYGALHGNVVDASGEDNRFDWGALAQAAYAVNRQWELFGRYGITHLDADEGGSAAYNEITVGLNYYLGAQGSAGHRAKLTLDAVYLPDGAPSNQTGLGILASEDASFVLRAQLQLVL